MKSFFSITCVFLLVLTFNNYTLADDHAQPEYFNFQVNLCKLNKGSSIDRYNDSVNDYIEWSKENDVEVYVARQTPIFPHDDFVADRGFDFLEILAGSHAVTGKAWDLWLGTKEGQKLSENWQKNAECYVKWGHAYPQYVDQEVLANDKDRVASWNWCSRNEGVSFEDLQAQHKTMVSEVEKDSNGLSGWIIMAPQTGAANAPGDFVHIAIFEDIEAYMEYKESFASGGWKGYVEYNENFATCRGEELYSDIVLNDPNN